MEDTYTQAQKIRPIYASLNELISRLMDIYAEYKHAKKELHILASELGNAEERHFKIMDKKIDDLGDDIRLKIENSLKELQEHYHLADKDVTNTVKELAAKVKMKKSYAED
jgi:gas vesicle protein